MKYTLQVLAAMLLFSIVAPSVSAQNAGDVVPISDARQATDGESVTIEGVITRVDGGVAFIQDESAALAIQDANGVGFADSLSSGYISQSDSVRLAGTKTEDQNLVVVNPASGSFERISGNNDLPEYQSVTFDELSANFENYESELVRVRRVLPGSSTGEVEGGENFGIENSDFVLFISNNSSVSGSGLASHITYYGVTTQTGSTMELRPLTSDDVGNYEITISELNQYDDLTAITEDQLTSHPLVGVPTSFTAVVVSYPKSSGLANPNPISRLHVFVTDTAAASQGREYMSLQVVESDLGLVESLTRGDIIEVSGQHGFYFTTAQYDLTSVEKLGNVNTDTQLSNGVSTTRYQFLLDPWTINLSELNSTTENGNYQSNVENYGKYIGAYARIEQGIVSNVSTGDRPDWAINADGTRIYTYDVSLRYRNDRTASGEDDTYPTSYNVRRQEDGDFVPPDPGSQVNINGFLSVEGGNDPDGNQVSDQVPFSIVPFEDGILWTGGQKFVDGQGDFTWPDDLEIIGQPAVVSNFVQTPTEDIGTDTQVEVSAVVQGPNSEVAVDSVKVVYTAREGQKKAMMTEGSNNSYSFTFPTFQNATSVSYYIETYTDNGITGRYPISGTESFFVSDGPIQDIANIQATSDSLSGPSGLAGTGSLSMNISALVVSGYDDGVVAVQQSGEPFSGVFLEYSDATSDLQRGDRVTINSGSVEEAENASGQTYTYIATPDVTVESSGNDLSEVVPDTTTQYFNSFAAPGELFEGMLLKFSDVKYIQQGDFGEFEMATADPETGEYPAPGNGVLFNEDTGAGLVGETGFPGDLNQTLKDGVVFSEAYGFVTYSYGAPKIIPRDVGDLHANDFTFPNPSFNLLSPENEAQVVVDGDLTIEWEETSDYDGNDVTYSWVLASADSVDITEVTADNDGASPKVTLPYSTVDNLLSNQGLEYGDTQQFTWYVKASDGEDTVQVASSYNFDSYQYVDYYNSVTLERSQNTAIADQGGGVPRSFELKQNYPNPFNPTTQIKYSVPKNTEVSIKVYNVLGEEVATLVDKSMQPGNYQVRFDAGNLASGVYFYRLNAGSVQKTQKMMLTK